MEKEKIVLRYDLREPSPDSGKEGCRCMKLCRALNAAEPYTEEYRSLLSELFCGALDETSTVMTPMQIDLAAEMKIGKRVFINNNLIAMARGGITIEDDVMIAPRVNLLSANHDLIDHQILLCSPIHIRQNAWIGANVTILPGVTVGKNAVVGAGAVVTKDIPDNAVAVGNPARVIKILDRKER